MMMEKIVAAVIDVHILTLSDAGIWSVKGRESQSRKRGTNGDPKDAGPAAREGRADSGGDPLGKGV